MTDLMTRPTTITAPLDQPPTALSRNRVGRAVQTVFNPPFLQRVDRALLISTPWLWATKLHRILWLGSLLTAFAALLGLLLPARTPAAIQPFYIRSVVVIALLQAALLGYWLFRSDDFHAERERAHLRDQSGWGEFGASLLALMLIGSSILWFMGISQAKLRQLDVTALANDALFVLSADESKWNNETNQRYQFDLDLFLDDVVGPASYGTLVDLHGSGYPFSYRSPVLNLFRFHHDREQLRADALEMVSQKQLFFERVAVYAGVDSAELMQKYDIAISTNDYRSNYAPSYWQLINTAQSNLHFIADVGHVSRETPYLLIAFAAVATVAIHGALLRFVYHNAGGRGTIMLLAGLGALAGFVAMFGTAQATLYVLLRDRILRDGLNLTYRQMNNVDEMLVAANLVFALLVIRWICRRAAAVGKSRYFIQTQAIWLYIMPFLLIGVPYLCLTLLMVLMTDAQVTWIGRHFLDGYGRSPLWSFYPYPWYPIFAAQFCYVLAIPFLKRQYAKLNALPRPG